MGRDRYNLSIAVFVMLLKGDELCMLRRSNTGWMDGCFSLPAGGLEKGETLSTAAARELKEETGVDAIPSELALAHTMHVWTENRSWIGHYFICREWSGVPFLAEPDKHAEVSWKNMSDLPEETIPYVRQAIEAINADESYSEYGWDNGR
ncbi:NUDIX hydrolase [Dickeya dianthicola]|jgi:8-oxo-dGTP pyrophosphatase MutT (NUDIX family)|uniref:NUDIX hydrolase n=1 Tax=Dickeya dianthicola TaxID=204039 RepID=UPI00136FC17F|nr:NUDIX domain-containing protein [Dickeya dianthicola]MCI4186795.1 NUDIX domain-containing protein [Dickeya dianthicola]MCI4201341.1 NUDIX domain-containing protein [Dickeya dianthicola]MCI4210001.1 NUDIX domain-containing protein [Dickeya dianthicola]MZI00334.1 NUDIX domain-containing protein [Dickeya dianthicola]